MTFLNRATRWFSSSARNLSVCADGSKVFPLGEKPASHLSGHGPLPQPRQMPLAGQKPGPTFKNGGNTFEQRYHIQHPHLFAGLGNDTPKSTSGTSFSKRLCDPLLSGKANRCTERGQRSAPCPASNLQQSEPANGPRQYGTSNGFESGSYRRRAG